MVQKPWRGEASGQGDGRPALLTVTLALKPHTHNFNSVRVTWFWYYTFHGVHEKKKELK